MCGQNKGTTKFSAIEPVSQYNDVACLVWRDLKPVPLEGDEVKCQNQWGAGSYVYSFYVVMQYDCHEFASAMIPQLVWSRTFLNL